MIKRQLNPLRIGKGLLCLIAMFVMLLAPQRAWAQTDYGLTVAGVTVTSDNATNIIGENISAGTVTYEDGSHTLTLDHATINGSVVVTGGFDLVVCLVGDNTIQGTGETSLANGISRGGGSAAGKLTFDIAKNPSGSLFFPYVTTPIAGFANIEYLNGLEWGCRDEGTCTNFVEGVGTEVVLASIGASLYVTKTKTTMTLSNNGGTVTYRKDDTLGHVLTLSGLTDLNNGISWYSPDNVTIEISGTNNSMSFSSSGGYNYVCFDGKPQSNISFRFTGATATLKMYDRSDSKSLEHSWISGFKNATNPTLSDGLKMVEIDEYRYDSDNTQTHHAERYITTETYGLNVKGIQVHNLEGVNVGHKDHILGLTYNAQTEKREYDTSITFNSSDSGNILTLNNATISYTTGNAIVSSITTPLTVYLTGENSITSGGYLPFVGAIGDDANLVFTTNTTGTPGSLTMTSTHTDFGPTSFFDGFKHILYPEEQGLLAAKSVNGNVVISQETGYGLKVAGIVVTEANKDHVLGNDNETVKFTPAQAAQGNNPATLTLNGARFDGTISWTSSDNLTVEILGSNEVDTKHDTFFAGNSNANITLTTNSETPGTLRLTSCYSAEILSGWKNNANVIYIPESSEGNAADYSWWADGISEQWTLRFNKIYNLWVNNVQLCSVQNRIDNAQILNSYISFNGSDTLTFNNYRINTDTSPFIKSGLSNLKINLIGENSVGCGQVFLAKDGDGTNKDFTFTAEGNGSLVITTTGGATNAWYTGHNEPTFKNDLVLTDNINNTVRTVTIAKPVAYDLTIAGTPVTSANAGNVFAGGANDGKVSFNASVGVDTAPIYTLTLNGATLTGPVVVGLPNLTIDIQGTNSITTNTTCIQKMTDTAPVLTFKSTSNEVGSLTLTNTSTETTGVNNISNISISNKLALIMSRYDNYTSNTYYFTAGEVHNAQLVPSYGVQVNDMQVYEGNATNVLGDNKVSFDKSSHTLTLNNVSGIEAISTTLSTLNIDLVGNNSLYRSSDGSIFESASGENVTINLKSTGATKGSLTMQTGENSSATFKGNNVTLTADNSLALLSGNLADNKGTLVYGVNYDLWISGTRVTSANASNIWGEGTDFEFDAKNSVLYYRSGGSTSYPVLSGLPNLTIKIGSPDNEGLYSKNNIGIIKFGAPQGVTITATSGTLTISKILDNTETVQKFDIVGSGDESSLIQGFSSVTYSDFVPMADGITYNETSNKLIDANGNGWNETTTFVTSNGISIPAPTMSKEAIAGADGISLKLSTNMYGTIKYSVNYEDTNETDITDATYDSENKPVISKPATVTAYATINGHNSTTTKGKYFDSNPNPFRLIYGADPVDLVIAPAIDESDGISITGIEANVTYNTSTGEISSSTMGSFGGPVAMSPTNGKTVILNNYFTMNFEVVPPAPTITLASDTYYSTHDPIEITAPELPETLGAKIMYKWNNNDAQEYEEAIPVQTGKLTAWVECTPEGQDAPVVSDEVTATYTIVNPTLVVNDDTFHNGWATYYSADGALELPGGIGAYVATGVGDGVVTVSQIKYIPEGVPVLLNNATETAGTEEFDVEMGVNLLQHADENIAVSEIEIYGTVYGLYNGTMMRVTGTISTGKNYLLNPAATQTGGAPQLTIVIDGETTGVNDVRSKKEDVRGDVYDLQGRKVKKPSKRGLYIQKGHKVVVNK